MPVREGILWIPYDEMEKEAGEILRTGDAVLMDEDACAAFADDFQSYADELCSALRQSAYICRSIGRGNHNESIVDLGSFEMISDRMAVSDPCYDADVWCRGEPEEVQSACSKHADSHPGIILELEYTDHDEEVYQRIRFKGKWCEHHDAAYHFMPFEGITIPREEPPLPAIEFTYGSAETEDSLSLMVLLGRALSPDELDSVEDSFASYAEENTDYCFEELIHDVLEAAGIEYWIISPIRTYRM